MNAYRMSRVLRLPLLQRRITHNKSKRKLLLVDGDALRENGPSNLRNDLQAYASHNSALLYYYPRPDTHVR